MERSYRFGTNASYAKRAFAVTFATIAIALVGCSEERPERPKVVSVGERLPPNWPLPQRARPAPGPQIEALRFSSLDVALGSRWDGDAVVSLDTTSVHVKTNLFDFSMPQTSPGRFHFAVDLLDVPAFLVRPYALHVIARNRGGAEATLLVPFRIHGRV